jgi:hypothetical protein
MIITWRWPLMKAETCSDRREHEIKHILLIVANEGFVLWFNVPDIFKTFTYIHLVCYKNVDQNTQRIRVNLHNFKLINSTRCDEHFEENVRYFSFLLYFRLFHAVLFKLNPFFTSWQRFSHCFEEPMEHQCLNPANAVSNFRLIALVRSFPPSILTKCKCVKYGGTDAIHTISGLRFYPDVAE